MADEKNISEGVLSDNGRRLQYLDRVVESPAPATTMMNCPYGVLCDSLSQPEVGR